MKTATIIILVALTVFSGLSVVSSSDELGNLLGGSVLLRGSQNGLGGRVSGLVKNILEAGLEPVGDLVVGIQNLLKLLAGVKPEIKTTLKGPLEELQSLLIQLIDAIKNHDVGLIQKLLELFDVTLKKLNTALAQLLQKYENDAEIKDLLDNIAKLVDDIVTKVVKLVKAFLKELFDKIANGLLPELKEFVAGLIKALDKAIAEANGDKVKEVLNQIIQIIYKLIENQSKINKAFLEAIITGNLGKLPSLVAGCKSNIAELKQISAHTDLPDNLKNMLLKVIELVDGILSKYEVISRIIEIIKNLLVTILGKILKELKGPIDGVLRELSPVTTELDESFKKLSELLKALEIGNIVDVQKIKALIFKVIKTIKAIIAKLWEALGDEAKEKLEKILQVLENKLKALKLILKDLVNDVKDIISEMKEDLVGLLKRIKEALAVAKGKLKEILIIIKGLLKALLEKILDLIKTVTALVFNVTNESLNKLNGLVEEIKDISLTITGHLESESGKSIEKEYKGPILAVVCSVNTVLELVELIKDLVV